MASYHFPRNDHRPSTYKKKKRRTPQVSLSNTLKTSSSYFSLLYSVLGSLMNSWRSFSLSSSVLDLVVLFAFVEEFFLFYLQRKDTSGIENRYFDLMLVPIAICVLSTVLAFRSNESSSSWTRFARGLSWSWKDCGFCKWVCLSSPIWSHMYFRKSFSAGVLWSIVFPLNWPQCYASSHSIDMP